VISRIGSSGFAPASGLYLPVVFLETSRSFSRTDLPQSSGERKHSEIFGYWTIQHIRTQPHSTVPRYSQIFWMSQAELPPVPEPDFEMDQETIPEFEQLLVQAGSRRTITIYDTPSPEKKPQETDPKEILETQAAKEIGPPIPAGQGSSKDFSESDAILSSQKSLESKSAVNEKSKVKELLSRISSMEKGESSKEVIRHVPGKIAVPRFLQSPDLEYEDKAIASKPEPKKLKLDQDFVSKIVISAPASSEESKSTAPIKKLKVDSELVKKLQGVVGSSDGSGKAPSSSETVSSESVLQTSSTTLPRMPGDSVKAMGSIPQHEDIKSVRAEKPRTIAKTESAPLTPLTATISVPVQSIAPIIEVPEKVLPSQLKDKNFLKKLESLSLGPREQVKPDVGKSIRADGTALLEEHPMPIPPHIPEVVSKKLNMDTSFMLKVFGGMKPDQIPPTPLDHRMTPTSTMPRSAAVQVDGQVPSIATPSLRLPDMASPVRPHVSIISPTPTPSFAGLNAMSSSYSSLPPIPIMLRAEEEPELPPLIPSCSPQAKLPSLDFEDSYSFQSIPDFPPPPPPSGSPPPLPSTFLEEEQEKIPQPRRKITTFADIVSFLEEEEKVAEDITYVDEIVPLDSTRRETNDFSEFDFDAIVPRDRGKAIVRPSPPASTAYSLSESESSILGLKKADSAPTVPFFPSSSSPSSSVSRKLKFEPVIKKAIEITIVQFDGAPVSGSASKGRPGSLKMNFELDSRTVSVESLSAVKFAKFRHDMGVSNSMIINSICRAERLQGGFSAGKSRVS